MSVTSWERQRAMSNLLRSIWDAHRDGRNWADVFEESRSVLLKRMEQDAAMVSAMT